jgi:3-oxoacyl-[acyl-carrier protein] reductase
MLINLKNKIVFITGGTSVLGSEIIFACLESGARVFFSYYKNREKAQILSDKGAIGFPLDMRDRQACCQLNAFFQDKTDAIDLFIHNAAVTRDKTIFSMSENDWDQVLDANLNNVAHATKNLLPFLYKAAQAKILFITSQVGMHGAYGQANYGAAKGGLIALAKSLAQELGEKKILVNALNPGFMESPLSEHVPASVKESNKKRSCLSSFCDPTEVANFVVYYASDYLKQVSGQIFSFDSRMY